MTIEETTTFLSERDEFIVSSHETPDADGIGAEYALACALLSKGKHVRVINADRRADAYAFMDPKGIIQNLDDVNLSEEDLSGTTAILVDTNDITYSGAVVDKILSKAREILIIDHHEISKESVTRICSFPGLSSTCEIIYEILMSMAYDIPKDVATSLFAGIVYDTGSFAYSKTGIGTFSAALDLVKRGAVPSHIHGALYESSSISALLLSKETLSTLELYAENRIAIQTITLQTLKETGSSYHDAEGLINVPLQTASIEISILLKENEAGTLRCSLRSKGTINVAQIAQSFRGGGHKSAAGFKSPYPLETTKAKVLKLVEAALNEA